MQKHTPGPWTANELGDEDGSWSEWSVSHNGPICYGGATTMGTEIDRSNASLIAAAPELLDALTDLVGGCGKEGDLHSSAAMNKARAAIAKATGDGE